MKVPTFAEKTPEHPEYDENEVTGWKTEAATVHVFECERTGSERVWGCEAA